MERKHMTDGRLRLGAMQEIHFDPLPQDGGDANVRCLDGGSFIASMNMLHANSGSEKRRLYNWCFLIQDQKSNRRVLWDLGMTSDRACYSSSAATVMESVQAVGPRESVVDQLARQGISSSSIDTVIFSHAHWDHCRPIEHEFPDAEPLFGPGTFGFCAPGHLEDPKSIWDGRIFDPKRATESVAELAGPWVQFGPFTKAMDFFGTGSLWIVQAPGHMPGNLAAVVKISIDRWILLGSDGCHSRDLLDGRASFATWKQFDGTTGCLHSDIPAAIDTVAKYKIMEDVLGVHVVLAHDTKWLEQSHSTALMSLIDDHIISSFDRIRRQEPV